MRFIFKRTLHQRGRQRQWIKTLILYICTDTASSSSSWSNSRDTSNNSNNVHGIPPPSLLKSSSVRHENENQWHEIASDSNTITCIIDSSDRHDSARMITIPGRDGSSAASTFYSEHAVDRALLSGRRRRTEFHLLSFALTFSIVYSFVARRPDLLVVFAICYLFEAWNCSTRNYLSNVQTPSDVWNHLHNLIRSEPTVRWTLQSYHYDHRSDDTTGRSDARTKVVTHRTSRAYTMTSWRDLSHMDVFQQTLEKSSCTPLLRLSFQKMLLLGDGKTRSDYLAQRASFVALEGRRDIHSELFTSLSAHGYTPKILAARTGQIPTLAKSLFFWIFTVVGLTVPYRIWCSNLCEEMNVTLVKESHS